MPVAGQPPVLDRPSATGNMALQRQAFNQRNAAAGMLAPPIVHDTLRSPGQPLDSSTRSSMESYFRQDFGNVRVHTDDHAAESALAVDAHAYTVGRDVVFGAGQYNPHSAAGQRMLAHELTHVAQQRDRPAPTSGLRLGPANDPHEREARESASTVGSNQSTPASVTPTADAHVQRFGVGDLIDTVSPGAGKVLKESSASDLAVAGITAGLAIGAPAASKMWGNWISDPRNKQFLDDLIASVKESPSHIAEFFVGEVLEAIREHLFSIIAVTGGLLLAESLIGTLTAAPEPTLLTKVVAVILQIIVIAFLVYFAGTEIISAVKEAGNWFSLAYEANGAPALISEASRSFVRMIWHIVMTVLAVAGVRARVRGFAIPEGTPSLGGGLRGGVEEGLGESSNVTDIASHPKYISHFDPPSGPTASGGTQQFFGPRGEALKVDPLLDPPPVIKANPPVATATGTTPATGPGVQAGPAVAAGLGTATQTKTKHQCGDPELPWTSVSLASGDRGSYMKAEPLTRCGPPGSRPSIHLPGWSCIQAAPGTETDYWVHAHLLHGKGGGSMDLHGPGNDPSNLILTDKSLNYWMWRDVEALAISRAHLHNETLSYEVTPKHVSNANDRRYFADEMQITLKQIDPITRNMIALLWSNPVRSRNPRTIPANCT
jgi:hypothetical protein